MSNTPKITIESVDLLPKMVRPSGLCTSIIHNDRVNAERIKFILDTFLLWHDGILYRDYEMQQSPRGSADWVRVEGLPSEFVSTRYRLELYNA